MNPESRPNQSKVVAASINGVAFALYRELAASENLLFSPLGVYCVLSILYEGARAETRAALSRLLQAESLAVDPALRLRSLLGELESLTVLDEHSSSMIEYAANERRRLEATGQWNERVSRMLGTATAEDLRLDLRIVSAIWIQEGYALDPGFLERIGAMPGAEAATLDFEGSPTRSCEAINDWVAAQTHGRIGAMLAEVPPLTRSIVANALYFKARWEDQFGEPKPGHFYLLDGTQVAAQMMTGEFHSLDYQQGADFWTVELPYCRTPVSMVIIVPTRPGRSAFKDLERQLPHRWTEICRGMGGGTWAVLTMPEFTVRGSHELGTALSSLGLGSVFSSEGDFSGVTQSRGFTSVRSCMTRPSPLINMERKPQRQRWR